MSLASGQTGAAAAPAGKDGRAAGEVRVLVVDDESYLADLVAAALKYEGWQTRTATSGMAALREARSFRPDLVVLDVMLPDLDGFEVLRRLRAEGIDTPVVFLTARDSTEDRVAGLTIGGDDYVTKPFSLEELVARLRALLRRMGLTKVHQDSELRVLDLTLDEESREVRRGGQLIELTPTEFELLRYLMRNPRRVLSKAQIPADAARSFAGAASFSFPGDAAKLPADELGRPSAPVADGYEPAPVAVHRSCRPGRPRTGRGRGGDRAGAALKPAAAGGPAAGAGPRSAVPAGSRWSAGGARAAARHAERSTPHGRLGGECGPRRTGPKRRPTSGRAHRHRRPAVGESGPRRHSGARTRGRDLDRDRGRPARRCGQHHARPR